MVPTGSSLTFDFWWKHGLRLRFCLNFQDLLGTSLILSAASSKVLSFDQKKMYTWYYFRLIFDVTEFAASGFFAVFEQFDWQRCLNHSTCLICQMFIVQFPRTKTGPTCGLIDVLNVFLFMGFLLKTVTPEMAVIRLFVWESIIGSCFLCCIKLRQHW